MITIGAVVWVATATAAPANHEQPSAAALPADTQMGVVELRVHDLAGMRAFYENAVGLTVLDETGGEVTLGEEQPVTRLIDAGGEGSGVTPTEAGLYHSAILYPSESALARTLVSISMVAPENYQGSADHAVSLAFYFADPEGNGLELYVDRPRDAWVWEDGEVQMGSAPLDVNQFVHNHLEAEPSADAAAAMGHVHQKVGDLDDARAFYVDALGFAVTANSEGAIFYAAGGYHHHLATNVWQSAGVGERSNPIGLGLLTVTVPDTVALDALDVRLSQQSIVFERTSDQLTTTDPWGNVVQVTVEP